MFPPLSTVVLAISLSRSYPPRSNLADRGIAYLTDGRWRTGRHKMTISRNQKVQNQSVLTFD